LTIVQSLGESGLIHWHTVCITTAKCCVMSKKILIVDDNRLMVEVMTYILISKGYEVIALYRGDDVLNNIKINHPDLIILDDALPGMDGREVCQLLKLNEETRNLPVIVYSGNDDIDESLKLSGAPNAVLHKPFDIKSLVDNVAIQLAA
jgi:DNA-binding response OmpR family regulator